MLLKEVAYGLAPAITADLFFFSSERTAASQFYPGSNVCPTRRYIVLCACDIVSPAIELLLYVVAPAVAATLRSIYQLPLARHQPCIVD